MKQLIENAVRGTMRKLFPKERTDYSFVDVILLYDVTTEQRAVPNPSAIFSLYGYTRDLDKRGTFRVNTISQLRLNAPIEHYVPGWYKSSMQNIDGRIYFRADQLEEFKSRILESVIGVVGSANDFEDHPNCQAYCTIASELSIFANGTAREQVMVIHSSLFERSELYDALTDKECLPATAPEKLAKRFKAAHPIGNLDGVKVVIVYKPCDKWDEIKFLDMVRVYKLILEPLGAIVFVQTDSAKYWGV